MGLNHSLRTGSERIIYHDRALNANILSKRLKAKGRGIRELREFAPTKK
jgi:hypothetical protein